MSECIPADKVCNNCACYESCIYANPGRRKDCALWKPDMSWVPVYERLPWKELKKAKSIMEHLRSVGVIGYISGAAFAVEVYFADDGNFYFVEDSDPDIGEDFDANNAVKIAYWMPLPEPPEATYV